MRINNTLETQKKLAKDLKKVAHEKTGIPDGADMPDELREVGCKFICYTAVHAMCMDTWCQWQLTDYRVQFF